jgi:hypothetical protein
MATNSGEGRTDGFAETTGDDLASDLPDDLRARVKGEIEPGERLLWASRSCPPRVLPGAGYYIASAIALLMLVGGVLVITIASRNWRRHDNKESAMPFGIILCVASGSTILGTIAQWINSSRERRRRTGAYYAVTDRRAIVWMPEPKSDAVRIIPLPKGLIDGVVRIERPDGSGTLELSCSSYTGSLPWYPFGFQDIHDVRRVEYIVRNNLVTAKEVPPRKTIHLEGFDHEVLM